MATVAPARQPAPGSSFVDLGDVALHVVTWRAQRSRPGRRMLLLHGLGGTTIHWELVGPALARRLEAVVAAVDLPGFGLSRVSPAQATLHRAGDMIAALLERTGPAELVGNSMGGSLAVAVAARRPELVRRLVLVTPAVPQPEWPHLTAPILPHNWPAAVPGVGPAAVAAYAANTSDEQVVDEKLARSFYDLRRVDARIRARMIELVRVRRGFPEAPFNYAAATRSLFWYLGDPAGMPRDLTRVAAPVHIIHGAQDRLIPLELAHAVLRARPDWRLEVFERCGHMPQLELPERFVAAVERGG